MNGDAIILFDGICNLCNSSVQYVIKHDPGGLFKFAALQSEDGQVFTRSSAALRVAKKLKGIRKLLYALILFPPFIRNFVYDLIAKNRYRWFGKKESCMVPGPGLQQRFLN